MRIRRYRANNIQEAMLKVKMDLGSEALILNTKKVRKKGLFKIFSKPMVEVLAAVDEYAANRETEKPGQYKFQATHENNNSNNTTFMNEKEEKISNLENKVKGMESLIQKMYMQLMTGSEKNEIEVSQKKQYAVPNAAKKIYSNMLKNEIEAGIVKQILETASSRISETENTNDYESAVHNMIADILGKPETIKLKEAEKPTTVIFVGPTGVGKTTTLAKIAANYALNLKKSVGLITADTYRIAAVEQLKTYAEILGIPITVVYSPADMRDAISNFSDKDLVLIDTAGRSQRNKAQLEELKSLIEVSNPDEVYLVLSTTTGIMSSREILKTYSFLKNYKLIFTKIDEAPVLGLILNIKYLTGKKLSYITTGQNVPDDIEMADTDKLTKKLLGRMA
ncbi:MAG: flagellar biosynthesis protein FlhF [Acetivibrionales bacterium]|jgi:flagellar biosynthesis protein FlhF